MSADGGILLGMSSQQPNMSAILSPHAPNSGNIITFCIPGFSQALNVKFPDYRLAVCAKCKKNYKTRELCRVRNCHTEPPWTTCFICVTLDASCTDDEGKIKQTCQFGIKLAPWQPYCLKEGVQWDSKGKTPVCAVCKKTNRTRNFCRERHLHRHLPWCTVYVTLTALDGSNGVEGAANGMYNTTTTPASVVEMSANASTQAAAIAVNIKHPSEGFLQAGLDPTDDINEVVDEDSSRSFLCMVNSAGCAIKWLDYEVLDESNMQVMNPSMAANGAAAAFGMNMGMNMSDPQSAAAASGPWMQMYPQFYGGAQAQDAESAVTQQQQWMAYQQWMMMMQAQAAQYQQSQQQGQEQPVPVADGSEAVGVVKEEDNEEEDHHHVNVNVGEQENGGVVGDDDEHDDVQQPDVKRQRVDEEV